LIPCQKRKKIEKENKEYPDNRRVLGSDPDPVNFVDPKLGFRSSY
jgi:hypothetical protein